MMSAKFHKQPEGVLMLSALLGYNNPLPDVPITRSHRIKDKPNGKSSISQKSSCVNYKDAVIEFIRRNPKCGAKNISSTLKIPHTSVQAILTKATIAKEVNRVELNQNKGCRPIYIYWIS